MKISNRRNKQKGDWYEYPDFDFYNISEVMMSMRGELISNEYQHMVWVNDVDDRQYSCYRDDVKKLNKKKGLSKEQKEKCLDISLVLGDTW